MARRNANTAAAIAGLAALAALMGRKSEDGGKVPVEDRPRRDPNAQGAVQPEDIDYAYYGEAEPAPRGQTSPTPARPAAASARPSAAPARAAAPTPARPASRQDYIPMSRPGGPSPSDVRKAEQEAERRFQEQREQRLATPGADAVEQDIDVLTPFPGLGRLRRGVQGAQVASRALTTRQPSIQELTFLGASGAREMTPRALLEGGRRGTGRMRDLDIDAQNAAAAQRVLSAPAQRIAGPTRAEMLAAERAAREAARREEMLRENAAAYGLNPNAPGYEAAMRTLRENLGGGAFTVKKKGGRIKAKKMASGGLTSKVSSVSKRADGIATRGKTKCKVY